MDKQHVVIHELGRQPAEELPSAVALGFVGLLFQKMPRPVAGPLRADVEVGGLVEHGHVMIPTKASLGPFGHQIQAFQRRRSVANDIAEAEDRPDAPALDVLQHRGQSLDVTVDVRDEGELAHINHRISACAVAAFSSRPRCHTAVATRTPHARRGQARRQSAEKARLHKVRSAAP